MANKVLRFQPDWESLKTHELPTWYDDCKLGIFIHWGLYSVPAWAELTGELGTIEDHRDWMRHNAYAEWYLNTIRIDGSPAQKHHYETYGEDFKYEQFADMFKCEKFNPTEWAELFKEAGAGYVVLTTKHHDGFCLYPSQYTDYNSLNFGPHRDLVGDLTEAVRAAGLKMGTYYSGLWDWTYHPYPNLGDGDGFHYTRTYEFADYSFNQAMELIDKYKPSVLWNDIGWPKKGVEDLPYLFSHYYNSVEDGVVNDRWWDADFCDYTTAEYQTGTQSLEKKWEMCRGLGLSFGYNQNEDDSTVLSSRELIALLAKYVSHNGNLLINIGPRADGTIPEIQASRLRDLGAWLKVNGEAIYGTCPWEVKQQDDLGDGAVAYYTKKGDDIYAIIDGLKAGVHEVRVPVGRKGGAVNADSMDSTVGADCAMIANGMGVADGMTIAKVEVAKNEWPVVIKL